jgi:hypothetical protein
MRCPPEASHGGGASVLFGLLPMAASRVTPRRPGLFLALLYLLAGVDGLKLTRCERWRYTKSRTASALAGWRSAGCGRAVPICKVRR